MSDAIEQIRSDYDSTPYESFPFSQSNPGYLATVAQLFGLKAPALHESRILELGCAAGGNILPLAIRYPKAHVVGVDLSPVQVGIGQKIIQSIGLNNIELRQGDLSTVGDELGKFDYIICHGVFSWVPPNVQQAILRICHDNLNSDGIAYVSYNTYPGWKAKEIIRDAMILRGKTSQAESNPLGFARGMIDFLREVVPENSLLSRILDEHSPILTSSQEYYLHHEYLEAFNQPVYFRDFLDQASNAGLAYLAESAISTMFVSNYGSKVAEPLLKECGGSQVRLEQYLDFVSNRTFRQTLLVHANRSADIRYSLTPERLKCLHVAASLQPQQSTNLLDNSPANYGVAGGGSITLHSAPVKLAMEVLNQHWPRTMAFAELRDAVEAKLEAKSDDRSAIENQLLNLIEVLVIQGRCRISLERVGHNEDAVSGNIAVPEAWRRCAAATGIAGTAYVTNAWHEAVILDPVEKAMIGRMDGKTSKSELVQHVASEAAAGRLRFQVGDADVVQESAVQSCAAEHVDRVFGAFARRFVF